MDKLGHKIDKHLHKQRYHEAWHLLRPFYCKRPHIFTPSKEVLQQIGKEFKELYQQTPPDGNPIHTPQCFNILDDIPDETEILEATTNLCSGKSPGPSSITNNDLKAWCDGCNQNPTPWLTIVNIVQEAFRMGELLTLLHCNILVLIPKAEPGKVRGIGLLKSI